MANDWYDDDDLDEDEREEREEERFYLRQAEARIRGEMGKAQKRYFETLFESGTEYHNPKVGQRIPWLVENLLTASSLVILGGTSKSGKTCFATALAMAVAKGERFMGGLTYRTPVLWCAFEESYWERWHLLNQFGDLPENFYTSHGGFKIDTEVGL